MNVCKEMQEYIERYPYPGWYVDVQGAYCFANNSLLIRIFYDKLAGFGGERPYIITVEKVYGVTLEYENSDDISKIHYFAVNFMNKYM